MTEIALAEEPFNIAVTCGADVLAAQGRPLVPVTLGALPVARLAVIPV
jgi:hypothetical protein